MLMQILFVLVNVSTKILPAENINMKQWMKYKVISYLFEYFNFAIYCFIDFNNTDLFLLFVIDTKWHMDTRYTKWIDRPILVKAKCT